LINRVGGFAVAGLASLMGASAANAALSVDVRVLSVTGTFSDAANTPAFSADSKHANIPPGGTVTVGVFLIDTGTIDDGATTFGLGSYAASVDSRNEQFSTAGVLAPWPTARTSTNTVLNGQAGQANGALPSTFDITSTPTIVDDSGPTDQNDTDLDVRGAGRVQSGGGGYTLHIGKNSETLLGTFTFVALNPQVLGSGGPSGVPGEGNTAQLNSYFTTTGATFGGLDLHALTNSVTAQGQGGNPLGTQLASAGIIGAPVIVTIAVPEPASIGLIAAGAVAVLTRRRRS